MSESLNKIERYRRLVLKELYNQCTSEQQELFCRMYKSLEEIPKEKIDHAIRQCERTIEKNKTKV